jgi:hypothetical protein
MAAQSVSAAQIIRMAAQPAPGASYRQIADLAEPPLKPPPIV